MAEKKVFKDPYTLDGRIRLGNGVTREKIIATERLVSDMLRGDRVAEGKIREALVSTSDFAFNLAALVNAQVIPELDETERVSSALVGTRRVSDFRDVYLYETARSWDAGAVGDGQVNEPLDTLPTVPEGTPYPEAFFKGELIQNSGIRKTGLRLGVTWEALVNDTLGVIQILPDAFRELALNTPERDAFRALIDGVGSNQELVGGTTLTGITVAPNAPLSRAALILAKKQLKKAVKDNYGGTVRGGFNLVVATGEADTANFYIQSLSVDQIQDGALLLNVSGGNELSDITVIESEYVADGAWYLVPKPGTTRRPVLDRLFLTGHEQAELRVHNLTGNYVGGSSVPPFEGSFDADMADWRVRLVTGTVLWSPYAVVWSDGSGEA